MRIVRVHAGGFGPFAGRDLHLAPGLTIVHGPNESGKSSWHAALYAGLCGLRRGAGVTKEVRLFKERHEPWDGTDWSVTVEVSLDDGRCLEIHQDLAGKVDSRVIDRTTGNDIASALIFEGAPDASTLLGLDRHTFLSTVCVRQADVVAVREAADGLQEQLQRAAATGGRDANAEEAIRRITDYHRDHVGLDRQNSTKPLRSAIDAKAAAEAAVAAARAAHEDYVELVRRRDRADDDAREAERELAAAVAAVARQRLDEHLADAPASVRFAGLPDVPASELRRTADDLEASVPAVDPALEAEVARASSSESRGRVHRGLVAGVAAAAAVGTGLLAGGSVGAAVVLFLVAAAIGGVAVARRGSGRHDIGHIARLEARLALQREAAAAAASRRSAASGRCAAWGLPTDPSVLRSTAAAIDSAHFSEEAAERWRQRTAELEAALRRAEDLVADRGTDDVRLDGDLDAHVERLDRRARELRGDAKELVGQVTDRERSLPSVPEAEEALAAACAELDRVRRLAADLDRAKQFLADARDRVHRDIAPVLGDAVTKRLSTITGGRYIDARVDPSTLEVTVWTADGKPRKATGLSHGTTEQIYLMLRLAMAEHLVTTAESAPFILDDALVQTDSTRAAAVLDLLHGISADRQVVVFSQEDDVLAWARENLRAGQDALVELDPTLVSA